MSFFAIDGILRSEGLCTLNGFLIKHNISFSLIDNITCNVYFMYVFPKCILQHCNHKLLTNIVHVCEIVDCLISYQYCRELPSSPAGGGSGLSVKYSFVNQHSGNMGGLFPVSISYVYKCL